MILRTREQQIFGDQVITINGKRWRFHNARITDSAINGIPQGKRAAEILAGTHNNKPSYLELLDTIRGASVAFCFGHSGMDRTISKSSEAWFVEVTNNDGKDWLSKPLISMTLTSLQCYLLIHLTMENLLDLEYVLQIN